MKRKYHVLSLPLMADDECTKTQHSIVLKYSMFYDSIRFLIRVI